jgi:hypothetical protein
MEHTGIFVGILILFELGHNMKPLAPLFSGTGLRSES